MLFLKQLLSLPSFCHKLATTCQIDSNLISNSKLKLDKYNFTKIEISESTAPPPKPYKRSANFLGHPVYTFLAYVVYWLCDT